MLFISLRADGAQIRSAQVQKIFQSKIEKLSQALEYLDRVGIHATIKIEGREVTKHLMPALETIIEVDCEDEGFTTVLEKMVERFSHKAQPPQQQLRHQ